MLGGVRQELHARGLPRRLVLGPDALDGLGARVRDHGVELHLGDVDTSAAGERPCHHPDRSAGQPQRQHDHRTLALGRAFQVGVPLVDRVPTEQHERLTGARHVAGRRGVMDGVALPPRGRALEAAAQPGEGQGVRVDEQ